MFFLCASVKPPTFSRAAGRRPRIGYRNLRRIGFATWTREESCTTTINAQRCRHGCHHALNAATLVNANVLSVQKRTVRIATIMCTTIQIIQISKATPGKELSWRKMSWNLVNNIVYIVQSARQCTCVTDVLTRTANSASTKRTVPQPCKDTSISPTVAPSR